MKRLIIITTFLAATGCQSLSQKSGHRPVLAQKLEQRGVSDANTAKIIAIDSDGGTGMPVTITAEFLIQEIWDTIWQSRPYKTWAASGFAELRFYTDDQSEFPQAEILVNITDRCHFEETFSEGYRCPGINKILQPLFKAELDKRKGR